MTMFKRISGVALATVIAGAASTAALAQAKRGDNPKTANGTVVQTPSTSGVTTGSTTNDPLDSAKMSDGKAIQTPSTSSVTTGSTTTSGAFESGKMADGKVGRKE